MNVLAVTRGTLGPMRGLLGVLVISGCVSSNAQVCSPDLVCPETAICDIDRHLCLTTLTLRNIWGRATNDIWVVGE